MIEWVIIKLVAIFQIFNLTRRRRRIYETEKGRLSKNHIPKNVPLRRSSTFLSTRHLKLRTNTTSSLLST